MSEPWSGSQAERHLRSLELFGMRFGLDRMRRMMTALGSPERSFRSIHVLGTNGKSSTTRMIAAILERHGVRTGTYTSPHLMSYSERVQVGERDIDPGAFAGGVARAAAAAERVNRTLGEDDHVTQFELLTAAAFWELARQGVELAVIEAGLGGRYDATSVIESEVTVLTNVGLEHTRWLGPTVADIAAEKLAVVAPGTPLALGAAMHEDALAVAGKVAGRQGARIVRAGAPWSAPLLAGGGFQRANFALAKVAAEAYLERMGIELQDEAVREAALHTAAPGRMQVIDGGPEGKPLTVLDGAHNPDAAQALAQALPELVGTRPLGLVLGVLEDKDAAAMLHTLLPLCERAWFTAPPSARALSPAALQSLARQQGFEDVLCEPHPRRALALAREWAKGTGRGGDKGAAVLATGSIYLVGELLAEIAEAGPAGAQAAGTAGAESEARSAVRERRAER
jgi:dihydrofolate synthase / folylpolyglutamate synthase